MASIIDFKIDATYGTGVATILETADAILEVLRKPGGGFVLTIHNRRGDTDRWDDLSIDLTAQHFAMLGSIG